MKRIFTTDYCYKIESLWKKVGWPPLVHEEIKKRQKYRLIDKMSLKWEGESNWKREREREEERERERERERQRQRQRQRQRVKKKNETDKSQRKKEWNNEIIRVGKNQEKKERK